MEYGNATKAAIEAGYSPRNAGQNAAKTLDNPNVKAYLESRLEQLESQKIADVTEVMQYLTRGMRQELEEEVLVVEGCGDGISEAVIKKKKISIKDSNKCAFWSSDKLTGNQTQQSSTYCPCKFWSSDKLTGNQTRRIAESGVPMFWSSDKLTGNQTQIRHQSAYRRVLEQ